MNRLLINTANEELVIVLELKDKIFSSIIKSKMHHNEAMLPAIDELLRNKNLTLKDIDEFGVVIGPGSFTGIRVGIATIKAFRDATKKKAYGINNLDLLYALANSQNNEIGTVAILGSRDSYFVAKKINDIVYKYDHNITHDELVKIAEGKSIGMFSQDESLNSFVVQFDPGIYINEMEKSTDQELVPIYYQLSQAENEKLKRGMISIVEASVEDVSNIKAIEEKSIKTNHLTQNDIKNAIIDDNYAVFVAKFNDEIVGYEVLNLTDELNVESIAVDSQYRNLGIATKLLDTAQNYAKDRNINILSLEVSKSNIGAYLLYKKYGFVLRRVRKNYYEDGSDCFEMTKDISK